jgi:predicted metal-dependent hydrolase
VRAPGRRLVDAQKRRRLMQALNHLQTAWDVLNAGDIASERSTELHNLVVSLQATVKRLDAAGRAPKRKG